MNFLMIFGNVFSVKKLRGVFKILENLKILDLAVT